MRQINLLPPEIAERRRARQIMVFLGVAGLALVAILMLVFLIQTARVGGERSRLEQTKRQTTALQRQASQLQNFAELEQTLRTKEQLLGRLTANEVRWSVLLADISLVIPSEVWLTNFSGSVQGPQGGAAPRPGQAIVLGTIQASGMGFSHLDVAKWLTRLADVREFAFPYLSLTAKTEEGGQPLVQFNSSVQLSEAALRRNQPGGQRQP
jgi:Tfp pilus assembly protein PilN